jgi:hypothetical protein
MGAIAAIETKYDGHRFRSRLEARWAVFMNDVGIPWEYEPEGYVVPTPMGRIRYLPDFWLGSGQWGEVKGYLDLIAMRRLYAIACGLTECAKGNDLVVLPNIPKAFSKKWPVQLHFCRKALWGVAWDISPGCALSRPHIRVEPDADTAGRLTEGFPFGVPDWAEASLTKARMARFEWGESG